MLPAWLPPEVRESKVRTGPATKPCLNCRNVGMLGELQALVRLPDTQATGLSAQSCCDLRKYHGHSLGLARRNPARQILGRGPLRL